MLGGTSAMSVATQAFVSSQTQKKDRTKYMSINTAITNGLSVCGPVFNLLIVALPHAHITLLGDAKLVFDNYTGVGYFLVLAQGLVLAAFHFFFTEPERQLRRKPRPLGQLGKCLTLNGLFPWPRLFLDPWLWVTNSWAMVALAFRTNALNYSIIFAVPLLTARDYNYDQLENR